MRVRGVCIVLKAMGAFASVGMEVAVSVKSVWPAGLAAGRATTVALRLELRESSVTEDPPASRSHVPPFDMGAAAAAFTASLDAAAAAFDVAAEGADEFPTPTSHTLSPPTPPQTTTTTTTMPSNPLALVLAVDASDSMAFNLPLLRAAVDYVLAQAPARSAVSVVAFGTDAYLLQRAALLTTAGRRAAVRDAVDERLDRTMGWTNLSAALTTALAQAEAALSLQPAADVAHVLLLTDGFANVGTVDTAAILRMLQGHPRVRVTTVGFNDATEARVNLPLLAALAAGSHGAYHVCCTPQDVAATFGDFLGTAASAAARNVRVLGVTCPRATVRWVHPTPSMSEPATTAPATEGDHDSSSSSEGDGGAADSNSKDKDKDKGKDKDALALSMGDLVVGIPRTLLVAITPDPDVPAGTLLTPRIDLTWVPSSAPAVRGATAAAQTLPVFALDDSGGGHVDHLTEDADVSAHILRTRIHAKLAAAGAGLLRQEVAKELLEAASAHPHAAVPGSMVCAMRAALSRIVEAEEGAGGGAADFASCLVATQLEHAALMERGGVGGIGAFARPAAAVAHAEASQAAWVAQEAASTPFGDYASDELAQRVDGEEGEEEERGLAPPLTLAPDWELPLPASQEHEIPRTPLRASPARLRCESADSGLNLPRTTALASSTPSTSPASSHADSPHLGSPPPSASATPAPLPVPVPGPSAPVRSTPAPPADARGKRQRPTPAADDTDIVAAPAHKRRAM